ncbi:hypothetical protein RBI13_18615 [Alcaligenaceae bacterium A4P071]|nr:hypothetical protein [Alcaligenaceae bacterium A4P071]
MFTLDPIVVIGNQYGFPGTDWETLQNNPGDADPQILAQLYQAATAFAETPQYAEYALDELNGYKDAGQTENVRKTLRAYAHADNRYAAAQTAGAPITTMEAITVFGDVEQPVSSLFPWFGGPLMPLSAFYHYAFGNGSPKSVSIHTLHLDTHWEQLDILAGD